LYKPLLSPYLLQTAAILFFSILSLQQYWVRNTGY
jgi:hypothetical protein